MFARLTNFFVRYVQRFMPDPYLFAIILTFLVVVLNFWLVPQASMSGLINAWYEGVWGKSNIFTFALQMTLILVCGTTLAQAPLIKRGLVRLAALPKNQVQAAILCFLTGAIGSLINWGLGLVIGTILAKEIAKRLEKMDFGYVVAAAYMGFIVWTSGFSSSIVLANADASSSLNIIYKMTKQTVGVGDTVFKAYNLIPVLLTLVTFPFILKFMAPKNIKTVNRDLLMKADAEAAAAAEQAANAPKTFATRVEGLWIFNLLLAAAGLYEFFGPLKGQVTINTMILLFTVLGLLFHWTPIRYARAFVDAAKSAGSLLLQYPLYGGIMALMAYVPAKGIDPLETVLARDLVSAASVHTLPFLNFIGSCLITMFVPSGGGHWAVQGPISIEAAMALKQTAPEYLGKISMSVSFGEGVFNMVQPFWALPVIALAGLTIRDIMGYCLMALIFGFVFFGGCLLIF
ncbi:TIGR00366 family protein [Tumebacillus flagellatus]|uniref:Short-chain fatty acid transporter n=1 Tax=Tumebacillus flagellatus TaxID=1157490 RepID=A0A074M698_9BACL|nr:TIGR00366 family protein [Tumebacillus flagellatus]KEO81522.1 short-chain fatty acid transporter [Tumebacillus flagellatus]